MLNETFSVIFKHRGEFVIDTLFCILSLHVHDMYVLTVPWMGCLHKGQSLREGAHWTQQIRWPQGKKTTPISWSMQILQMRASFKRRFSCSRSTDISGFEGLAVSICEEDVEAELEDVGTGAVDGPGALTLLSGWLGCSWKSEIKIRIHSTFQVY